MHCGVKTSTHLLLVVDGFLRSKLNP